MTATETVFYGIATSFLASIIALLLAMFLERYRRPVLFIDNPNVKQLSLCIDCKNTLTKVTTVDVGNKPMPRPLRWAWDRNPAHDCRAKIEFLYEKGERALEKAMVGRWTNTPEPITPVLYPSGKEQESPISQILDPSRIQPSVVIGPGRAETLDVVFRINDEEFRDRRDDYKHCWGWNNEGYRHRHMPKDWKLPEGQFIARITVASGGQSTTADFKIINDLGFGQFRLERVPTR